MTHFTPTAIVRVAPTSGAQPSEVACQLLWVWGGGFWGPSASCLGEPHTWFLQADKTAHLPRGHLRQADVGRTGYAHPPEARARSTPGLSAPPSTAKCVLPPGQPQPFPLSHNTFDRSFPRASFETAPALGASRSQPTPEDARPPRRWVVRPFPPASGLDPPAVGSSTLTVAGFARCGC